MTDIAALLRAAVLRVEQSREDALTAIRNAGDDMGAPRVAVGIAKEAWRRHVDQKAEIAALRRAIAATEAK